MLENSVDNNNNHFGEIRVLNVHWGFSVGGVAKYCGTIHDLTEYAPISNDTVCVICRDWGGDFQLLEELGAEVIYIDSRTDFSWIRRLAAYISKVNPDILMTHGFNAHFISWVSGLLTRAKPVRFSSFHGLYYPPSTARKLMAQTINTFICLYLRFIARSVVTVSEYSKHILVDKGVPEEKIAVVHNGIASGRGDPVAAQNLRESWGVTSSEKLIGAVSRFDDFKGIEYLIQAFSDIAKTNNSIKLLLVGSGPAEPRLKTMVEDLGINTRVIFTGFRDDVIDCLEAIDIYVMPTLAENHSIALLEAMRAERPVIVTDVGGNLESVTHEEQALVVPPANAQSIQEALERLLADQVLAKDLSKRAGQRFLADFTTKEMLRRTAEWFMDSARQCMVKL